MHAEAASGRLAREAAEEPVSERDRAALRPAGAVPARDGPEQEQADQVPLDNEELVRVWGPMIRRRVRGMNRVPKHTEDITQHVFAELFRVRVIDKFLASPRFDKKTVLGFRCYLCTAVHNIFCNWCRTWYRRHRAFSEQRWQELAESIDGDGASIETFDGRRSGWPR